MSFKPSHCRSSRACCGLRMPLRCYSKRPCDPYARLGFCRYSSKISAWRSDASASSRARGTDCLLARTRSWTAYARPRQPFTVPRYRLDAFRTNVMATMKLKMCSLLALSSAALFGLSLVPAQAQTVGSAQEADRFVPATTNVWGADYPRVDPTGRVRIRIKAPDAKQVRLNFWSGPKVDMERQPDGFWTVTTPALVPGLHYYTLIVDSAEVSDPNSQAFFGGSKYASAVEVPEPGTTYYSINDVPHGQVREVW